MPLDTKVRIRLGIVFGLFLLIGSSSSSAPKCDKRPLGQQSYKTYGDNGFKLSVVGSPRLYRPGQVKIKRVYNYYFNKSTKRKSLLDHKQ